MPVDCRPHPITAVSVTSGTTCTIGERKVAFNGDFLTNSSHPNDDILPDGSGVLLIRRAGDDVQTVIVQNGQGPHRENGQITNAEGELVRLELTSQAALGREVSTVSAH